MGYRVKMRERNTVAGDILVFRVERPEGFAFLAGQFCNVSAPDLASGNREGLRKALSIASSPLEKDLLFMVRLTTSAFKRTLREMPEESRLDIGSPAGSFVLPADIDTPLVFLAGGMGVAPFRSMLRYAADAATGHTITLFYSSRVPEEALFLDEFGQIAARIAGIEVVATITRPEQSAEAWHGATGRLTPKMIRDGCADWSRAAYYLSGPPAMVEGMRSVLGETQIARDRMKQEI